MLRKSIWQTPETGVDPDTVHVTEEEPKQLLPLPVVQTMLPPCEGSPICNDAPNPVNAVAGKRKVATCTEEHLLDEVGVFPSQEVAEQPEFKQAIQLTVPLDWQELALTVSLTLPLARVCLVIILRQLELHENEQALPFTAETVKKTKRKTLRRKKESMYMREKKILIYQKGSSYL